MLRLPYIRVSFKVNMFGSWQIFETSAESLSFTHLYNSLILSLNNTDFGVSNSYGYASNT